MKKSMFATVMLILVLLFLYLPIVVMIGDSFNASRYCGTWAGFTMKWYDTLFSYSNRNIWLAFERSFVIAITATISSCVIGTTAALALHKWQDKLQTFHYGLIYTPLVMPEILLGISLLMMFTAIGLNCGMFTIWIAHTTFCVSYVTMTVLARLQDFDDRIMEAAYDLGASTMVAFFKVQLPILMPGIIAGGLLAFTLSIDDFVITFFVTGPGADTLPLQIYSMIKHSKQLPVINCLSTLMLVFTCVLVALSRFVSNRKKKGSIRSNFPARTSLTPT
jgi:spermidine/putrescine transport system permease protein